MGEDLKKRTWHYLMRPSHFSMCCDKCEGSNIDWSEWEGMIWCHDCQIDTKGFEGIFGSPIGLGVCRLLGISFDRWNMADQRIEYFQENEEHQLVWLPSKGKE